MQNKSLGDFRAAPELLRNGLVDFHGHDVGEVVNPKRRRMRIHALRHILEVPRPKGPKDEVSLRRRGILRDPVDAAMLARPFARANMVAVVGPIESRRFRLLGRKKAALPFRNREKSHLIFPDRPSHMKRNIACRSLKQSTQTS